MTTKPKTETEFFTFSHIRASLLQIAEVDSLHYVQDGDDLLLVNYQYRDLDARRERWLQNTNGLRPFNCDRSRYDAHGIRFSESFLFRAGEVVTSSMLIGKNHTTSAGGLAILERLYKSEAVIKIGKVEMVPGSGLTYRITLEGADLLWGTQALALEHCARSRDKDGNPERIPAGKIFLATRATYFPRAMPPSVERGMLVPEAVIRSAVDDPASLITSGAFVPAGEKFTEYGKLELLAPVAEYFRNMAAIREDNRIRNCTPDDEQRDFLNALLFVACAGN